MSIQHVGIIMSGVTGRMGTNQHLLRSILAIRDQGGVPVRDGDFLMPDPILLGRNAKKLQALSEMYDGLRWSTSLEECLANPDDIIYFDAQTTSQRYECAKAAIEAGKHVYCEKPSTDSLETALELARLAEQADIKHGVVQDKLFLPGLMKLKRLVDSGFFGRILSIRGEFGYWVFEGDWQPAQRPSWNYRSEDGGGIIVDMLCHWRYVLDNIIAPVKSVMCLGATHIPRRFDEQSSAYVATADDAAYAIFELENDIVAQINSSWCVRVYRDELVTFQVDGTHGSAVAGLRECKVQHRAFTPKPVWNPDVSNPINFYENWQDVPDNQNFQNGFKTQWELFLKHVVCDTPFPWDLFEGAKGVQLAELGLRSWHERSWVNVPPLER
ncbi:MAG: Gfo/Idh/MocA family oxidoreductase [Chloroflexi bacterium]|nr:Gfo/Idh/MocA family oxidoreductase [Chloroflexota bacterium]